MIPYTELQPFLCKIKALERQLEEYRNGTAFHRLREEYEGIILELRRENRKLKQEIGKAHEETKKAIRIWTDYAEHQEKEQEKAEKKLKNEIGRLERYNTELARQRDNAKDKLRDKIREFYETAGLLEEEKEKNRKLTAQINRDFENSSIPSSLRLVHKKIPNTRKKTEKKPGAQSGHKGHGRKRHEPTEIKTIPSPERYMDVSKYLPTGKEVCRQMVYLDVSCRIVEYRTKEFIEKKSGHRVHAVFPEGYVNDVNYDGSVKALAFLLANECNVSGEKVTGLLKELTGGELEISEGMVNGLCEEFSAKTVREKKEIEETILHSPVANVDFTNANVNGESAQVLLVAAPVTTARLFVAREQKGHKGIRGTLIEDYNGTLVHDHDKTFFSYGSGHQECMQHNIRYAIGSGQNEPDMTWNTEMLGLFREMIHYRNGIPDGEQPDPGRVAELERRYDKILELAEKEYEDDPPTKYYRDGYNLFLRLREYKESELRFLHDMRVPSNNSICERLARIYKRKQKQAMVIRSYEHLKELCNALSVVYSVRPNIKNMYEYVTEIFNRKRAYARKKKKRISEPSKAGA